MQNDRPSQPDTMGAAGVGVALGVLMVKAGLAQSVLVRKLGTTQSAIARMESGCARTSLASVERAGVALGCDLGLVFQRNSA